MEEIFTISKDYRRAKSLLEMALERFADIKKEEKSYKIIEQYYEIIKELITALMYSDGYKTLSHKALIVYLENKYKMHLDKEEFILIDELRKLRNNILYYGEKIDKSFLDNKEVRIKIIINKLLKFVRNKFA